MCVLLGLIRNVPLEYKDFNQHILDHAYDMYQGHRDKVAKYIEMEATI